MYAFIYAIYYAFFLLLLLFSAFCFVQLISCTFNKCQIAIHHTWWDLAPVKIILSIPMGFFFTSSNVTAILDFSYIFPVLCTPKTQNLFNGLENHESKLDRKHTVNWLLFEMSTEIECIWDVNVHHAHTHTHKHTNTLTYHTKLNGIQVIESKHNNSYNRKNRKTGNFIPEIQIKERPQCLLSYKKWCPNVGAFHEVPHGADQ